MPIYVEGDNLTYTPNDLMDWLTKIISSKIGRKPENWKKRYILFIDGLDEMKTDEFIYFINAWASEIKQNSEISIVFTCRTDSDPSSNLGIKNTFIISDLEKDQIINFITIYSKEFHNKDYEVENVLQEVRKENLKNIDKLTTYELSKIPSWQKSHRKQYESYLATESFNLAEEKYSTSGLIKSELAKNPYWLRLIIQNVY